MLKAWTRFANASYQFLHSTHSKGCPGTCETRPHPPCISSSAAFAQAVPESLSFAALCVLLAGRLASVAGRLAELEAQKAVAVAGEDYDAAKAVKAEIDHVRVTAGISSGQSDSTSWLRRWAA